MEAGGQWSKDSKSQYTAEVLSSQVFMDNLKGLKESNRQDPRHNVQEFEVLRRNLEKQVNAIQKP